MEKKNRYLLYSIFYASLLLVAIGIYTYGYNPPTCDPPGCNLPAPINTGSTAQSKQGYLAVGTSTAPTIPLVVIGTSYFSGNVGIGTSTPWGKFSVTNTGTGPSFIVEDSTSPDSTPFIVDASGKVGIGTTTPNNTIQVANLIDFNNADANTKLGYQAGKNIVSGAKYNTFVGYQAGMASSTGSTNAADYNTGIGYYSLYSNITGTQNTAIGSFSLFPNTTGNYNTAIGHSALYNNQYGANNVALGNYAGYYANATSTGNVFLGSNTGPSTPQQVSNRLYIHNAGGTPLIYGDFTLGRVGIGTTSPGTKLSVVGLTEAPTNASFVCIDASGNMYKSTSPCNQ